MCCVGYVVSLSFCGLGTGTLCLSETLLSRNGVSVDCSVILYSTLSVHSCGVHWLFVHVVKENVLILDLWVCSIPLLQVGQCVDTLCKYLENIIQNPSEEKFQKIRMTNRVYQDRVAHMEGAQDFLIAAGFKVEKLPYQDGEEDFWVFSEENLDSTETMQVSISFYTYIINQLYNHYINMFSHILTCVLI